MSSPDAAGPDQLNRLSCTNCKERKVRCGRVMPQCGRCKNRDLECVYPVRAKRRPARSLANQFLTAESPNSALSTIHDRLQRLEAQTSAAPSSTSNPSVSGTPLASDGSGYSYSPVTSSTVNGHGSIAATPQDVSHQMDAMTVLKDAVDRVQVLRQRSLGTSVITSSINIPTDLAKTWMSNFFLHMPSSLFIDSIDKRVIELLPDVIDLPHIHVDPLILVICYCMMYHGCSLRASNITTNIGIGYMNASYVACWRAIPLWEREASGTKVDLIASLLVTRIATECFDYDLAWRVFKHACEYCQVLNLHILDSHENRVSFGDATCDDERRGFWEIIQIDLFYRLILNTPPAISNNPWKVNLPWLNPGSQTLPPVIQSIAFLASSRISLVIARFFAMLDDPANTTKHAIVAKTEYLCRELQQIFIEWQLDEWMSNTPEKEQDFWVVADVLFTGYASIVFMFRKMVLLDSKYPQPPTTDLDIPDSPIVEDAARRIVDHLNTMLVIFPYELTMTILFGSYRCFVAFAYLANTILRAEDVRSYMADIKALERLGNQSSLLSRGKKDVMPLVKAMDCEKWT